MLNDDFEKMQLIYSTIKDIDKILMSNSDEKFDDLVVALKNINRKEISDDVINTIGTALRTALLEIYNKCQKSVNDSIATSAKTVSEYNKKKGDNS